MFNNHNINVIIEGHCDERGTVEYNIALGQKRANAVKKLILSNGINSLKVKIKTVSFGKSQPDSNDMSENSYALNRRAVTKIEGDVKKPINEKKKEDIIDSNIRITNASIN